MKFQQWPFKILRKQNVTDGRMDAHTDGQRENSIPTTNKVCVGYKYDPSLSKAVGPVDPSFLDVKKSHFNKNIHHTASLGTPQNRKYM